MVHSKDHKQRQKTNWAHSVELFRCINSQNAIGLTSVWRLMRYISDNFWTSSGEGHEAWDEFHIVKSEGLLGRFYLQYGRLHVTTDLKELALWSALVLRHALSATNSWDRVIMQHSSSSHGAIIYNWDPRIVEAGTSRYSWMLQQNTRKKSDPFDMFDNVLVKWYHLHESTPNSCLKPPQIMINHHLSSLKSVSFLVVFHLRWWHWHHWHRWIDLPDDWSTSRSAVRERCRRSLRWNCETQWWEGLLGLMNWRSTGLFCWLG